MADMSAMVAFFKSAAFKPCRALTWMLLVTLTTVLLIYYDFSERVKAMVCCFLLATTYVASLYVWDNPFFRDHPSTIKRRFLSVAFTTLLSPIFIIIFRGELLHPSIPNEVSVSEILGIRSAGLVPAILCPLFLTMVLFSGPLLMQFLDGTCSVYLDIGYWRSSAHNLIWLKNHVVAPFSEEFTFRACMLPLLLRCFQYPQVVIVCPLFFGVAHLHHLAERLKAGTGISVAITSTAFQFVYTTAFGAYAAFLFLRTGHLAAPFVAHAFCNHMGFPDLTEVMCHSPPKRVLLAVVFSLGLVAWALSLHRLTDPMLFDNHMYPL